MEDAIKQYGDKIMMIAEKFQEQVRHDIDNQMKTCGHTSYAELSQRFYTETIGGIEHNRQLSYHDQFELQMNSILGLIPLEIVDNFDLGNTT
jgi:hypothetical protein